VTRGDGAEVDVAAPAENRATIVLQDVSRWYGNVVAVNGVSFTVSPGITGLLGPNGAGKSTVLHMLAGFLEPSAGEITVLGEPAWRHPELYRRIGLVPERESVYGSLSGYEFVRLNARLQGLAAPEEAVRSAIREVDLGDAADRPTAGYSKGMKQRIKVAAALVHDPTVLLLDEPFNGADPRQRLHLIELLQRLAAEGRTIIFSSHILEEVERLAERVLVVVAGRLAASGNFREIRRLMIDRPHTFTLRTSDDRRLASALVGEESVVGVEMGDGRLTVRTSQLSAFALAVPVVAHSCGVTLRELRPTDESLEDVFSYLVSR
jgi:ABC-2 type transport system ATP-binding protein